MICTLIGRDFPYKCLEHIGIVHNTFEVISLDKQNKDIIFVELEEDSHIKIIKENKFDIWFILNGVILGAIGNIGGALIRHFHYLYINGGTH